MSESREYIDICNELLPEGGDGVSESQYLYDEIRKQRERINTLEGNCDRLQATATSLRELLRETVELLYVIRDHYSVNEITTGEMIECIEKELADGD